MICLYFRFSHWITGLLWLSEGLLCVLEKGRSYRSCTASCTSPLTLIPCDMSRGRGGPYNEHYHRHTLPHLQDKQNYYRPGPPSFFPRTGPQQIPYSGYYNSPNPVVVPKQPPAPPFIASAPPISSPKPDGPHIQNHSPSPGPNSFQYQQVDFLRAHRSEAPDFRANPQVGGVVSGQPARFTYRSSVGFSRYPSSGSSPRIRGGYNQDQGFARSPVPRFPNQNQFQSQTYSLYSNRLWSAQADPLCDSFSHLSIHRDNLNRREPLHRYSVSSSPANSNFNKVNITLTPDIQDKVHRALGSLNQSESIPAKVLAKKLRLPKKIVNKALYSLEQLQKASKQGLNPPEWSLYRDSVTSKEDQNCVESPLSPLCVHPDLPQKPQAKFVLVRDTSDNKGPGNEEESDLEASSLYSSSFESESDSEELQSPAKGHHRDKRHQSSTNSPDQDLELSTMGEQKQLILRYLLNTEEASALNIAKNVGLTNAKQVNPTLYALEKHGEVIRNSEVSPPTWELSTRCRRRMERSLKAVQNVPADGGQMEQEVWKDETEGESNFLPSAPPPIKSLETLPPLMEQSHNETVGFHVWHF